MPDMQSVEGVFQVGRLIGVPSYHYDPIFGQIAVEAIEKLKPSVVALELPSGLEEELDWAASCWPDPVVSASHFALFPFVPGDSIFESFMCAKKANIPSLLIDLPHASPASKLKKNYPASTSIGPEWSKISPKLFLDAADALMIRDGQEDDIYLAREAYMANALSRLLDQDELVLWVGGMAHWTRMLARIHDRNYIASSVQVVSHSIQKRMRLGPRALYRMTRRLPWLVRRYTQKPQVYEEHLAMQTLALEAASYRFDNDIIIISPDHGKDDLTDLELDEQVTPIDVAKMLQYARNLAATAGLRERPGFIDLLTSSAAMISPIYAGRLYALAFEEIEPEKTKAYDALDWEIVEGHEQYKCGNDIFMMKPWWKEQGGRLMTIKEIRRRVRDELFKDLPAAGRKGQKSYWACAPRDEDDYISFLEYVLRKANFSSSQDIKYIPFSNGLCDGIDVRATLRNWIKGDIYVREEQKGYLKFTNGAIDWTSTSENSDLLTGKIQGGWIDPDLVHAGSCSRETNKSMKFLSKDPWTQLQKREFSLITLDCPTYHHHYSEKEKTFYYHVIKHLVDIQKSNHDNLYGWLDIMFHFCKGKPFAYYSRYIPSPKIHRIAWKHDVQVIHFPLQRIPLKLLDRHKQFRFFAFTSKQWQEFERRRSTTGGKWSSVG